MRDYSKVVPKFWTGETCKALRKRGSEGVVVALYLMTSPGSNMLGLYYQPQLFMAHETGLGVEGASKGLAWCIEEGFCRYDEATEMVWVIEMAKWQIAEELKPTDNRCAGIQRDYDSLPANPFLAPFFDRYVSAFHLSTRRDGKGASKPLRSQEQEQEQEQEHEQDQERTSSLRSDSSAPAALTLVPESQDRKAREKARIAQIAEDAKAAYNRILAKPTGLLSACSVLNKPRMKAVEKALPTARQICHHLFGNERVTPKFWEDYFTEAAGDDFHSGRGPYRGEHANWKPDFEFLLRETTMAKLFDRAVSEDAAA